MTRPTLRPEDEAVLERLTARSETCARELTPTLGPDTTRTLLDAAVCEVFGWLLDRSALGQEDGERDRAEGAAAASRSELLDFFHRFWWMAEMTLEKGVGDYAGLEIEQLREVQSALCGSLVRQYPTTVGRFGRETLARDWRAIVQELPRIWEAQTRLESSAEQALAYSGYTADLREILQPLEAREPRPEALIRLRTEARARLRGLKTLTTKAPGEH